MRSARLLALLVPLVPAAAQAQSLASGPDEPNQYVLPDPLRTNGGTRVATSDAWPPRRAEILELFRANVYGRVPAATPRVTWSLTRTDPAAMNGAATLKQVTMEIQKDGTQVRFPVTLFVPNERKARVPVFLLINNRGPENTDPTRATRSDFWPAEAVVARGYAIAAFQVNDVAADREDGFKSGVHPLLDPPGPRAKDAWGKLAAWAWSASRVVDYLRTDADIDPDRIALVGHSRGGKAALWAAAEDTRVAMAVSNESGCTGAKLSRRLTGESVARITQVFPYWFAPRYLEFAGKEDQLPIDQHMLIGLVAPRPVYVASAEQDANADPRGEYLGLHHAGVVYGLWGHAAVPRAMPPVGRPVYAGPMGYHIRTGGHDLTLFDWQRFCDFADRVFAAPPPSADAGADASSPDASAVDAAAPGPRDAGMPAVDAAPVRDSAPPSPATRPPDARRPPMSVDDEETDTPAPASRRAGNGCSTGGEFDACAPWWMLVGLVALLGRATRSRPVSRRPRSGAATIKPAAP